MRRPRLIDVHWRGLLALSLIGACGGRSSYTLTSSTPCVPGRATACACADGSQGVQLCASDGKGLLACSCSSEQGGTGAAGGTSPLGAGGATGGSGATPASSGGAGAATTAGGAPGGFSFVVNDAEYSRALDELVILTASPNELHVVDPATQADTVISLPLPGRAVSVAPDGLTAVVGHDGWVSEVDLVKGTLLQTVGMSAPALDVVLAANHYAYVFPVRDQWTNIRSVNLTTGKEEEADEGMFIYAGTLAKLEPDKLAIYGAQNGLSPSDIEKYDISGGLVKYLYDSPYHGDYYMCGDLWFSEDGSQIYTRCGNVFDASANRADDMRYAGSLGINQDGSFHRGIAFLTHSSAAHEIVALLGDMVNGYGNGVRNVDTLATFDDTFFNAKSSTPIARLGGAPSSCSHVFVHSSGTQAFALCSHNAAATAVGTSSVDASSGGASTGSTSLGSSSSGGTSAARGPSWIVTLSL